MATRKDETPGAGYARLVSSLARAGKKMGLRPARPPAYLADDLYLARLRLSPESVTVASKCAALLVMLGGALALAAATFLRFDLPPAVIPLVSAGASLLAHAAVLSYPARAAATVVREVLRDSMAGTNLMVMSLRQEQSLSSAIVFASGARGSFARELRRCIWEVVMARHAGFEEAMQRLGDKLARHSSEFKSSMDALVTASYESTREGLRRALDRANSAMVAGAKRRIEDFALCLSTPSMVMFGLGILLPLMVGSFLPMLSWNLWSLEDGTQHMGAPDELSVSFETVFVMNCLFPALAVVVALSASARHPMASGQARDDQGGHLRGASIVVATSLACLFLSSWLLDGLPEAFAVLGSCVAPAGVWLASRSSAGKGARTLGTALERALFRTGARMTEGKNFERAFAESAAEVGAEDGGFASTLALEAAVYASPVKRRASDAARGAGDRNALEALEVVREASTKDEQGAGFLAMDLVAYLKDLHELDLALRTRLKPVVSMMKVTTHVLAPVVLGVTFAIYVSLASIVGAGADAGSASAFFLVLGIFLAETNAVVMYFVWGIEGTLSTDRLMASTGQCLLCSEMVYAATAFVVAA